MLGVQDIYALRHKVLVEGKSQRQVAREMGLARDTVRRYLATPLPEPRKRKRPRSVLEQVRPRLEQLVEEWSERTTAKQRITGRRLQRALREEGYEVGLTLVLEYLREWRRTRAEVYVPLVHRPGESAQADFFEVSVELAGERRKAWLFLMRLMHLGARLRAALRAPGPARLPRRSRAGLRPLRRGAPAHGLRQPRSRGAAGAVPAPRPERALRGARQPLRRRALLRAPRRGARQGRVESRGRGVRLQVLTPIPRGDSLGELSERMQGEVDRLAPQRVWERFASEQPALRPLPDVAFEARRLQPVSVSRSALVRVEGAWYSVPERWAGLSVTAWLGVEEVTLSLGAEQVSHPRQRFGGRRVSYRHYLGELSRKPQALRQVAPELLAELGEPYGRLWALLEDERGGHEAARALARLLRAPAEHGEARVRDALEACLAGDGRFDELAFRRSLAGARERHEVAVPEALRGYRVERASARDYDRLLPGGAL